MGAAGPAGRVARLAWASGTGTWLRWSAALGSRVLLSFSEARLPPPRSGVILAMAVRPHRHFARIQW